MKNFVQPGDTLTVTAPSGGTVSGAGYLVGAMFGVATTTRAAGEDVPLQLVGVVVLPKASGALAQGAKVYWDNTNKVVTGTASGNTLIGVAALTVLTGDAEVAVRLNGSF